MYLVIAYRDHATDIERPKWLKVKGTRFMKPADLERTQLAATWDGFLNVMTSMDGIDPKKVLLNKPVPKKRGRKPKK